MTTYTHITAQSAPSATTWTTLHTVSTGAKFTASSISVCNRSSSATATFRVVIRKAGVALSNEQYLYSDTPVGVNDTFQILGGWTLNSTDKVDIYASTANLSFTLFGQEIS